MTATHKTVACGDIEPNRRRGAEIRVLLGPATVGATTGFLGVAVLAPGECIAEHYHPYSEEFLYVVSGTLTVDLDGEPTVVHADEGVLVPINGGTGCATPAPSRPAWTPRRPSRPPRSPARQT